MTEPTEQDRKNAALRASIAEHFQKQYAEALSLAESILGPGWEPAGKHSLVTHQEADRARREGGRAVAYRSVITARNDAGETRHFLVEDRREVPSWEEGFGPLLTEPDTSRTIEVRGEQVHPHRYEIHWSGFEADYRPQSAEKLAAARARREAKAVEREAEGSLFADVIRAEGFVPKRKR